MKFIKRRHGGQVFDAIINLQNDDFVTQIVFVIGHKRYYFSYLKKAFQKHGFAFWIYDDRINQPHA